MVGNVDSVGEMRWDEKKRPTSFSSWDKSVGLPSWPPCTSLICKHKPCPSSTHLYLHNPAALQGWRWVEVEVEGGVSETQEATEEQELSPSNAAALTWCRGTMAWIWAEPSDTLTHVSQRRCSNIQLSPDVSKQQLSLVPLESDRAELSCPAPPLHPSGSRTPPAAHRWSFVLLIDF